MRTVEILLAEHRCIGDMLSCLERLAEQAGSGEGIDREAAAELILLIDSFADGLHQRKEEEVLFPVLLERVGPADEAKLRDLLGDHREEWSSLQAVHVLLREALQGDAASLEAFARAAADYVRLQRGHVMRENQSLVAMAESFLTPEDDERIVRGFEHLEAGARNVAGVFEEVRALCQRVGVRA